MRIKPLRNLPSGSPVTRRSALSLGAAAAAATLLPDGLLTTVAAQDDSSIPTFRTEANEVVVPVSVTDTQGRFVSDLKKSDFEIWDQNYKQSIKFFSAEHNQPVERLLRRGVLR